MYKSTQAKHFQQPKGLLQQRTLRMFATNIQLELNRGANKK